MEANLQPKWGETWQERQRRLQLAQDAGRINVAYLQPSVGEAMNKLVIGKQIPAEQVDERSETLPAQ